MEEEDPDEERFEFESPRKLVRTAAGGEGSLGEGATGERGVPWKVRGGGRFGRSPVEAVLPTKGRRGGEAGVGKVVRLSVSFAVAGIDETSRSAALPMTRSSDSFQVEGGEDLEGEGGGEEEVATPDGPEIDGRVRTMPGVKGVGYDKISRRCKRAASGDVGDVGEVAEEGLLAPMLGERGMAEGRLSCGTRSMRYGMKGVWSRAADPTGVPGMRVE